jgi:glycine/D-amino acid oxidase-like deaminating enzyme
MDTRMLAPSQIAAVIDTHPGSGAAAWKGGMITPSDARAEPFTAVRTIATAVRERGGLIRENCAVRTVEYEAGSVARVATEDGVVRARAVVCAAGAWSNMFLANIGISLPQLAVRATVARTEPAPEIFSGAAALSDFFLRRRSDGGYTVTTEWTEHFLGCNSFRYFFNFRPSRKVSAGIALRLGKDLTQAGFPRSKWDADSPSPFETHRVLNPEPSAEAVRRIEANMAKRVPALAGVKLAETWAGMIDATPDIVPVIDRVPGHDGLFVATGFSGHGFGIGPGAGRAMARLVTGDEPGYDMNRFRFSRFSDGSDIRPGPAI